MNKNKSKIRGKPRKTENESREQLIREIFGKQVWGRLNFVPPWLKAPMRYSDVYALVTGVAAVTEQVFRANSIFDPDRTGVGHQPLGHDQLLPMYERYIVDKLEWKITVPPIGTNNCMMAVGIINNLANYNTVPLFTAFCEAPQTTCKPLGSQIGTIFTGSCNIPPFIGIGHRKYYSEVTYSGTLGATNPGETIELHIVTYNSNAIGAINSTYSVEITYHAIVYDPILPAQS